MTIDVSTAMKTESLAGDLAPINFSFRVFSAAELRIELRDSDKALLAVAQLGLHYTVQLAQAPSIGGVVTPIDAGVFAGGRIAYLLRQTAASQQQAFGELTRFPGETVELGQDRIVAKIQEIDRDLHRVIKGPPGETAGVLAPLAERAGKVAAFDEAGNLVSSGLAIDGAAVQVVADNLDDIRAAAVLVGDGMLAGLADLAPGAGVLMATDEETPEIRPTGVGAADHIPTAQDLKDMSRWDVRLDGVTVADTPAVQRAAWQARLNQPGARVFTTSAGVSRFDARTAFPTDRALEVGEGAGFAGFGSQYHTLNRMVLTYAGTLERFITHSGNRTSEVTISHASPLEVTWPGHGFSAGSQVSFAASAGGALNGGLNSYTTYHVLAAGLTANTFRVSETNGGAAINSSSAGSGVKHCSKNDGIHSLFFEDVTITTGGADTAVTDVVNVTGYNHVFRNVVIDTAPGGYALNGFVSRGGSAPNWLNEYNLKIGSFRGAGLIYDGSDSAFAFGIYSGNQTNMDLTAGSTSFIGGHVENAGDAVGGTGFATGNGQIWRSPNYYNPFYGSTAQVANMVIGYKYIQNGWDVVVKSATAPYTHHGFYTTFVGNVHANQGYGAFKIENNVHGGQIAHGVFLQGAGKYIQFEGAAENWTVSALFDKAWADIFDNPPNSLQYDITSLVSGPLMRRGRLLIAAGGEHHAAAGARLSVFGGSTVATRTGVIARFGIGHNSATFDAWVGVGNANGNGPWIGSFDGEQTAAAGLSVIHNAVKAATFASDLATSHVAHQFDLGLTSKNTITIDRPGTEGALTLVQAGGATAWGIGRVVAGTDFVLYRFNAGTFIGVAMQMSNSTGYVGIPGVYDNTTASPANVFVSSSGGALMRSTSSLDYKRDVETLDPALMRRVLHLIRQALIWYRSRCEADRADWSYIGVAAEVVALAEIAPWLVTWRTHETVVMDIVRDVEIPIMEPWPSETVEWIDGAPCVVTRMGERQMVETAQLMRDGAPVFETRQARDPETGEPMVDWVLKVDEDGRPVMGRRPQRPAKPGELHIVDDTLLPAWDAVPVMETAPVMVSRPLTMWVPEAYPISVEWELETPEVEGFNYERAWLAMVDIVCALDERFNGVAADAPPPAIEVADIDGETLSLTELDRGRLVSGWIAAQGGAAVPVEIAGRRLTLRSNDIVQILGAMHAA